MDDEIPIYEKLGIGEALIISRDENDCFLVAENQMGDVVLRKVKVQETTKYAIEET